MSLYVTLIVANMTTNVLLEQPIVGADNVFYTHKESNPLNYYDIFLMVSEKLNSNFCWLEYSFFLLGFGYLEYDYYDHGKGC